MTPPHLHVDSGLGYGRLPSLSHCTGEAWIWIKTPESQEPALPSLSGRPQTHPSLLQTSISPSVQCQNGTKKLSALHPPHCSATNPQSSGRPCVSPTGTPAADHAVDTIQALLSAIHPGPRVLQLPALMPPPFAFAGIMYAPCCRPSHSIPAGLRS